jgi:hypothetical protein
LIKCFGFWSPASAFNPFFFHMSASAFGRLLQLLIHRTDFRIKIGFSVWSPASASHFRNMSASAFRRLLQLLIQTTHFRIKICFSFWSPASAFGRLLQHLIQTTHFWIEICFGFSSIAHYPFVRNVGVRGTMGREHQRRRNVKGRRRRGLVLFVRYITPLKGRKEATAPRGDGR